MVGEGVIINVERQSDWLTRTVEWSQSRLVDNIITNKDKGQFYASGQMFADSVSQSVNNTRHFHF
jgi:hypothetical protein